MSDLLKGIDILIGIINIESLSSKEKILNVVRDIYFADVERRVSEQQRIIKCEISSHFQFQIWNQITLGSALKAMFDRYRNDYRQFNKDDFIELNRLVVELGVVLPARQVLFHGRASRLVTLERPISCSLLPQKAVYHARKHRNHELNGKPIYIYAFTVLDDGIVKGCLDFNDADFGDEYEVLLQAGLTIVNYEELNISDNVYVVQCGIKPV